MYLIILATKYITKKMALICILALYSASIIKYWQVLLGLYQQKYVREGRGEEKEERRGGRKQGKPNSSIENKH